MLSPLIPTFFLQTILRREVVRAENSTVPIPATPCKEARRASIAGETLRGGRSVRVPFSQGQARGCLQTRHQVPLNKTRPPGNEFFCVFSRAILFTIQVAAVYTELYRPVMPLLGTSGV